MPTRSSLAERTSADNFGTGSLVVPATGTFTPPNNSLLVVKASAISNNNDAFDSTDLTITDSVGLTWTSRVTAPTAGWPKGVRIWTALANDGTFALIWVPTSQTVTVVTNALTGVPGNVRIRLYDPTTGTYSVDQASVAKSSGQSVATGGERVIVVDAA